MNIKTCNTSYFISDNSPEYDKCLLNNITVSIATASVTALMGPSGAGKSKWNSTNINSNLTYSICSHPHGSHCWKKG